MANTTNYAASYFKHPTPIPINGEPTKKSPKRIKTKLRANASSVDTDLGGGDHGYLGLVLIDAKYARINPTPAYFSAPNFPAGRVIIATDTAVEAMQTREMHAEKTRIYREYKNVEKALLRHIYTSIEENHI